MAARLVLPPTSLRLLALYAAPSLALAQARAAKCSVERRTLSTLIADPEAKAVMLKYAWKLTSSDGVGGTNLIEMGSEMTPMELLEVTRSHPSPAPSDETLNRIDLELAKLAPGHD